MRSLREFSGDPLLPVNYEAEQHVLGTLLLSNAAYGRVADWLYEEHFANALHGRIYAAIARFCESGTQANPITLAAHFNVDKVLSEYGGARYLAELAAAAIDVRSIEDYARAVFNLYRSRVLISLGDEIVQRAYKQDLADTVDQQLEDFGSRVFELENTAGGSARRPVKSIGDAAATSLDRTDNAFRNPGAVGISTGIDAVDRIIGGFEAGAFYCIGGRPGHGKSALATTIALRAAENGYRPYIFSAEMTSEQIGARLIAGISGISTDRQKRGDFRSQEFDDLFAAREALARLSIEIDDNSISLGRLSQQIRFAKRRGVNLVLIDYLQLIASAQPSETRAVDIGRISNGVTRIAKDVGIPIVALSQLSRDVERRDDKRPQASDLRGAGEIEQDAEVIALVYRAELYLQRAEPKRLPNEAEDKFTIRHSQWSNAVADSRGKAEIIIAKNRGGATGTARVIFDPARCLFMDPSNQGRFW